MLLDRLLLDHGIDREVFADIAQKREHVQPGGPVQVVHHSADAAPASKSINGKPARATLGPARHHVGVFNCRSWGPLKLGRRSGGRSAYQGDRPVTSLLKAAQHQQRHQRADMQAVGGRDQKSRSKACACPPSSQGGLFLPPAGTPGHGREDLQQGAAHRAVLADFRAETRGKPYNNHPGEVMFPLWHRHFLYTRP